MTVFCQFYKTHAQKKLGKPWLNQRVTQNYLFDYDKNIYLHKTLSNSSNVVISFPEALRRYNCRDVLDTKASPSDVHKCKTHVLQSRRHLGSHCIATRRASNEVPDFQEEPKYCNKRSQWNNMPLPALNRAVCWKRD